MRSIEDEFPSGDQQSPGTAVLEPSVGRDLLREEIFVYSGVWASCFYSLRKNLSNPRNPIAKTTKFWRPSLSQ